MAKSPEVVIPRHDQLCIVTDGVHIELIQQSDIDGMSQTIRFHAMHAQSVLDAISVALSRLAAGDDNG